MDLFRETAGVGGGQTDQHVHQRRPALGRRCRRSFVQPGVEGSLRVCADAGESGRQLPGPGGTDTGNEQQRPHPGDLIAWVLGQPEKGQQVFDVGHLHELQAAVLDERDVAPAELQFESEAMVRRTEEHRLPAQRESRLPVVEDGLHQETRLTVFVFAQHELSRLTLRAVGPEVLLVPLSRLGDDAVGDLEQRGGAAVVAFQGDDGGVGELRGKVEDVPHRGRAERVDGLGVVAHHGDTVAVGPEQADDLGLQRVGVLVFVHQHAIEAGPHRGARRAVLEEAAPEQQEIVVVEHGLLGLAVDVAAEQRPQVVRVIAAPRESALQNRLEPFAGVDAAAVDVEARGLLGEATLPA